MLMIIVNFLQTLKNTRLINWIFAADPVHPKRVVGFVIADGNSGIANWDTDKVRKPWLIRQLTAVANLRIFNTVAIFFNLEEMRERVPEKLLSAFPFDWYADTAQTILRLHGIAGLIEWVTLAKEMGAKAVIIDDADADGTPQALLNNPARKTTVTPADRLAIRAVCRELDMPCILSFSAINIDQGRSFMTEQEKTTGDGRALPEPQYAFQGYIGNAAASNVQRWLTKLKGWLRVPEFSHLEFYKPSKSGNTIPANRLRETFWIYWNSGVRSTLVYGIDDLTDWAAIDLARVNSPISDAFTALIGCLTIANAEFANEDMDA